MTTPNQKHHRQLEHLRAEAYRLGIRFAPWWDVATLREAIEEKRGIRGEFHHANH